MKLLLLTAGTRGDVEPFAALAAHAAAAGHEVHLGVPDNSGVDLPDVPLVPLDVDFAQLMADQGVSPVAAARALGTVIRPAVGRLLSAAVRAVLDVRPDVVVYHPKVLTAPAAASAVGARAIVVETVPTLTPSRAFPMPGTFTRSLGPFNRSTYRIGAAAGAMFRREIAAALGALGTAVRTGAPDASLVPVSRMLLERPSDWPETTTITGAWVAPQPAVPPDPLVARFIEGEPFLYAGFGSMAAGDAVERARVVIGAARTAGVRALLATGWGGLRLPPEEQGRADVLSIDAVAHSQVLPHTVVAVHHGGAGTAHAVVRAGVPSVVVPFMGDQPFWGRRMHAQGLAAPPIPVRRLDVARLVQAIAEAVDLTPRVQAAAALMREEHGAARALEVIAAVARVESPEETRP